MRVETFIQVVKEFSSLWNIWTFVHYNTLDPEAVGIKAVFQIPVKDTTLTTATSVEDDDDFIVDEEDDPSAEVCFYSY